MSLETEKLKSEIRNTCLVALTRREFSTKELKEKLRSRFDADGLIDTVINELTAEKLLCDERYTESFVLARVNRGQGRIKIKADIHAKGISAELVNRVIAELKIDWVLLAQRVLKKKGKSEDITDKKQLGKTMRFLQYRGFDFDEINQYEHVKADKAETEMTYIALKEDGFRILNARKAGKKAERIAGTLQDTLPGVLNKPQFFVRYRVEVEILKDFNTVNLPRFTVNRHGGHQYAPFSEDGERR